MKSYTTGSKYCDNPRDGKTWAEFFSIKYQRQVDDNEARDIKKNILKEAIKIGDDLSSKLLYLASKTSLQEYREFVEYATMNAPDLFKNNELLKTGLRNVVVKDIFADQLSKQPPTNDDESFLKLLVRNSIGYSHYVKAYEPALKKMLETPQLKTSFESHVHYYCSEVNREKVCNRKAKEDQITTGNLYDCNSFGSFSFDDSLEKRERCRINQEDSCMMLENIFLGNPSDLC
jgi:hypothetical protein